MPLDDDDDDDDDADGDVDAVDVFSFSDLGDEAAAPITPPLAAALAALP